MKDKYLILSSLVFSAMLLSGCDTFRNQAGRLTSKGRHAMRIEIIDEEVSSQIPVEETSIAEEAMQQAVEDSLIKPEQQEVRSEEILDSLKSAVSIISPSKLGGLDQSSLSSAYYIIIGSFKDRANADKLVERVKDAGYPATVISLKTGMNAVGICESNDAVTVNNWLDKVKNESFCPKDVWVLARE